MEERSEPSRVEVELTAADGTRRGRRRRRKSEVAPATSDTGAATPDPPVATRPPGEGTGDGAGEAPTVRTSGGTTGPPRRTLAIGLAAGTVGILLGWILGGTSASTEQATTATSGPTATAGSVGIDEALEPIDTVRATTTSRPRRTTTSTTVAPAETTQVVLNPKLADADFRVVGTIRSSLVAEIDVAAGSMTSRRVPGLSEPFAAVIGDGWVVAPNPSSGRVRVIWDDGEQTDPDLGEAWSLLWVEGTDLFWRGADRNLDLGTIDRYELVDVSGEPTGPTIDAGGTWPLAVDPAGGILTVAQGKTYSLREDGVAFVGPGELLAISDAVAVLRSCDELMVCGALVVDRATGEQRRISLDAELVPANNFWFGPISTGVASDGGAAALLAPTNLGIRLVVVDLVTGDAQELVSNLESPGGLSWSPDGRFGVFVDGLSPMLFDRETGTIEPLGEDLGPWSSVEIRPPTE